MKNILGNNAKRLIILFGIVILVASCEYETEIRSADYSGQKIYMPAAYGGFFYINNISRKRGDLPFEGNPYRYVIDTVGRKFTVPLSAYRSGIDNVGGFTVDIKVNTDTINKLITSGDLNNTILLPSDTYSIVASIEMPDGKEIAVFNLVIDLDFLRNSYPHEIYALGVGISSTQRETVPKLGTTIVVVDTKIMKPTASFTFAVDGTDTKKIFFTNSSLYAVKCLWDFGDGTKLITDESSLSYTYTTPGTYTVTLTAIGITGNEDKSIMTDFITIL